MFTNRRRRKEAEELLERIHHAWEQVNPGRFITPEDEALFNSPYLVTFNSLIGGGEQDRFAAITLEDIYDATRRYEAAGLIYKVTDTLVATGDNIVSPVFLACYRDLNNRRNQEYKPTELDNKILETSQKVIACLNQSATHIRRKS